VTCGDQAPDGLGRQGHSLLVDAGLGQDTDLHAINLAG
jgi:hypothetical protein